MTVDLSLTPGDPYNRRKELGPEDCPLTPTFKGSREGKLKHKNIWIQTSSLPLFLPPSFLPPSTPSSPPSHCSSLFHVPSLICLGHTNTITVFGKNGLFFFLKISRRSRRIWKTEGNQRPSPEITDYLGKVRVSHGHCSTEDRNSKRLKRPVKMNVIHFWDWPANLDPDDFVWTSHTYLRDLETHNTGQMPASFCSTGTYEAAIQVSLQLPSWRKRMQY